MTASEHSPLIELAVKAMAKVDIDDLGSSLSTGEYAPYAQAAVAACHAEDMREALQWYASEEAYRTEGKPDDTVYDRMHRRERVVLDRGERARAVLAKLDGQS